MKDFQTLRDPSILIKRISKSSKSIRLSRLNTEETFFQRSYLETFEVCKFLIEKQTETN